MTTTREQPWRVRVEKDDQGRITHASKVYDAETGDDVSRRFPVACAKRLVRSAQTGRPVRLRLFLRDANGEVWLDSPDHVASESAWVLVC